MEVALQWRWSGPCSGGGPVMEVEGALQWRGACNGVEDPCSGGEEDSCSGKDLCSGRTPAVEGRGDPVSAARLDMLYLASIRTF